MTLDTLIEQIKSLPSVVASLQEGIVVVDTNGAVRYHSPQFAELVGASDEGDNIAGKHIFDNFPFEASGQKRRLLEDAIREGKEKVSTGVKYVRPDGERYVNIKITPTPEHDAAIIGFVDITREFKAAIRDGLTGAYSQSYYKTGLRKHIIDEAVRTQNEYLGVIGIDLKEFKIVNDEVGHHAGDKLLRDLVGILQSAVREADYVVRDGGDEFLVLCPGLDEKGIKRAIERIEASVSTYNNTGDRTNNPLLRINPYIFGVSGNSDYQTLFEKLYANINAQKRISR